MILLRKGFTLIELIVVIAVLGILATVVLIAINPVKQLQKARDAQKIAAAQELKKAISNYILSTGKAPINRNPGRPYCSNQPSFLQELIDGGEMKRIPVPPSGTKYCYYDYNGSGYPGGDQAGALVVVQTLEAIDPTTVAPAGSCRPFTNNWCSGTVQNKDYCLCTPY